MALNNEYRKDNQANYGSAFHAAFPCTNSIMHTNNVLPSFECFMLCILEKKNKTIMEVLGRRRQEPAQASSPFSLQSLFKETKSLSIRKPTPVASLMALPTAASSEFQRLTVPAKYSNLDDSSKPNVKACRISNCANIAKAYGYCAHHGVVKNCKVHNCPKRAQVGGKCFKHGGGKICLLCPKRATKRGYCNDHHEREYCIETDLASGERCKRLARRRHRCQHHMKQWRAANTAAAKKNNAPAFL